MVHNGIEYADMQLIAEAWDTLRRGLGLDAAAAADVFERWNRGPLESFLVDLTAQVARVRDPLTGQPLVDLVLDKAGQKGTGRWTAKVALDLGVAVPTIAAAIDARVLSSMKEERVAAARVLGGSAPALAISIPAVEMIEDLRDALHASRICAYAQGMALILAGSDRFRWGVDLAEIGRIWKGGCIIRAKLLDPVRHAFAARPSLANLLLDEAVGGTAAQAQRGWRRAITQALAAGIPMPAHASALAYYDSYRSPKLPQNLTQAQRDAFGAHTYERVDAPGHAVHTDWS
jgi:6-phosphogluconate dehydrogenase